MLIHINIKIDIKPERCNIWKESAWNESPVSAFVMLMKFSTAGKSPGRWRFAGLSVTSDNRK